ncbi:MAG TPA: Z1 domain-containing protein [Streptosporangiaceae bacterium]|nr:Z1 domain-containing protein [Streptosporangiaceae bacterium]
MQDSGQPSEESLQKALRIVLAMLPQDRDAAPAEVTAACDMVHSMLSRQGDVIDLAALRREAESRVAVWQEASTGLDDATGHVEWLPEAKASRNWPFWDRYRRYLEDSRLMPRQVVWRVDETTDRVLGKLEDPNRAGKWRRDSLVVGHVQSGKTANYVGLVCKAADAGYKLIVILAGIDNGLRSQTQLRVDEGFLGFDTQYQQRYDEDRRSSYIGVGALPGAPRLKVASLTTSAESGDFRRAVARNINIPIGDYPVVLVIKKHRSILDYVRKWIVEVEGRRIGEGNKKVVRDVPVLVIDDEADNASVNVAATNEDTDPSRVNAAIRDLLESFEKAAYVGYTATPFANIYSDPAADHDRYGADIFPSHFIESLQPPSNYLGPERVFGLQSEDPEADDVEPAPIVRAVYDYAGWMPDNHKKDWVPAGQLPGSLTEAISGYVLACAARRARGQVGEHNSMLVHVTRFQDVQNRVADQVGEQLLLLRDRIRYGDVNAPLPVEEELHRLWERDFVPTTAWFPADQVSPVSWAQVWTQVRPAAEKIQVRVVNGTSRDALQYYEHRRDGLSVIAVGGNKLSRGLTLEGLSVSYYLRATKMYDTLLQMGRWFGYRPGYEDLCRLYTTPALRDAYVEITAANDELRREFEEMAVLDAKPEEFGLRVRTSPAGLAVTARNRMRRGLKVKLSYSGDLPETVAFDMREATLAENVRVLERFAGRLDAACQHDREGGSVVWSGVPAEEITEGFLADYIPSKAHRVRPAFIAEYIRRCQRVGELGDWTVRLVSSKSGQPAKVGPYEIGLVERAPTNDPAAEQRYRVRRIVSPADESTDFGDEQWRRALEATRRAAAGKRDKNGNPRKPPDVPSGTPLRRQRRTGQALLLLYPLKNPLQKEGEAAAPVVGFAISFPFSGHSTETEYVVNDIWQQQAFDEPDTDEDADE